MITPAVAHQGSTVLIVSLPLILISAHLTILARMGPPVCPTSQDIPVLVPLDLKVATVKLLSTTVKLDPVRMGAVASLSSMTSNVS